MRLECPACDAAYDVPEGLLGPSRKVRCVRCGRQWVPGVPLMSPIAAPKPAPPVSPATAPPDPAPAPLAAPLPDPPTPLVEAIAPPDPPPDATPIPLPDASPLPDPAAADSVAASASGRALRLAWVGSLLVLMGLGLTTWQFRGEIAAAWPPAQRLWSAAGG